MPPCRSAMWRVLVFVPIAASALGAQVRVQPVNTAWNNPRTSDLIDRAIARRSAQLADTGLADYRAVAHGYLTFLAQLGEGYPDPPQIVRADELAVEVYWRAPNQSKQRVVGRRDTLMLPTDITYHRDHLAIVQNNFPAIIRLGDGDEVRDVPHPLSARGRDAYDFATADSLTIRVGARTWNVLQVDVRPRDDRQARAVGSLYLDRETASVVRMSLSFTRAALLDPALEDVSVVLDNGLVEGRFWLPRRQEIEIRRSGTWLEFPARGIIRGEWDLCCVEVNRGAPAELFVGPEIAFAPPAALAAYPFPGRITDSLPARLALATAEGAARRVQDQAAALVRAGALARASGAVLSVRRFSDFARVNRVEGLALGGGATLRLGAAYSVRGDVHYGFDDRQVKHVVALARQWRGGRLAISAFDELRAAGDVPESSLLGNSIAAQEIGVDLTDEYRVAGAAFALDGGTRFRWRAAVERSRETAVVAHATPFSGSYRPALAADANTGIRAEFRGSLARFDGPLGAVWDVASSVTWRAVDGRAGDRASAAQFVRGQATLAAERPLATGTLVGRLIAASVFGATVPEQARVLFGGPVTAPGYDVHAIRGSSGTSVRLEWRARLASFPLPLGRFGTTRVPVVATPFVEGAWVDGAGTAPIGGHWFRTVGVGVVSFHDVIRVDLVRGVDAGGRWAMRLDFGPGFWPIL